MEQFLQGLFIASGEELMGRLAGMQTQIDTQQTNFTAQMSQAMGQLTVITTQLREATARASQAEEERRQALVLASSARGGGNADSMVDGKGVGQLWKYSGKKDQDFQEWIAKFSLFVLSSAQR